MRKLHGKSYTIGFNSRDAEISAEGEIQILTTADLNNFFTTFCKKLFVKSVHKTPPNQLYRQPKAAGFKLIATLTTTHEVNNRPVFLNGYIA